LLSLQDGKYILGFIIPQIRRHEKLLRNLFADEYKRRDNVQIYADIIKVTQRPTKITKILRYANIQYFSFKDIVNALCKAGFLKTIEYDGSKDAKTKFLYKATDSGLKWCKKVEEIYNQISEVSET